ncbi:MAG: DUF5916 domain-containing protein [Tunicatimonas sp.]|uniref:DUF5916 domain-containing protein n=1 Tax=Tunicatimonas sp. TaxID=1940096 RepID=UPI003C763913
MRKVIMLLLLQYTALSGIAQHSIQFIESAITADGILDEAAWQQLTPYRNFQNFFPINEGPARLDTDVRIFQDGEYLNIALVYHDSLSEIRVNSLKRDNYEDGFHLSDCVGVVIDPYGNQNRGYFFAVNGQGVQLDALIANYDDANLSWDALWESGYSVQGTDKVYEMKIPLSTFSYNESISDWNFQFYTRDAKDRMYTVWNKFERGFLQYDTRFLESIAIENLQPSELAKTTLIPSVTAGYERDVVAETEKVRKASIQPSVDVQYKISDGLRLDATLNPDFSQVEVDQQVTNLTRFNIVFPERRNFFIENSDMFTTLQLADDINPFYSRFIGASQDILTGLKLSGNASSNTRIGLLNVQSKSDENETSENYTVASVKQQFGNNFSTTGYIINRQSTRDWAFRDDFNRVVGLKANFLSINRKWSGFTTYSRSDSDGLSGDRHAFSAESNYTTRTLSFSTKVNTVGKNYLTDIGFVPRISNYDALRDTVIREGYTQFSQSLAINHFPQNQNFIQSYRPVNASVDLYWDEQGEVYEANYFYNTGLFFANQTSTYLSIFYDDIQLKYAFDPLRNGNLINPGHYKNSAIRVGYNSDYTRNIYGSANLQFGSFYGGNRTRLEGTLGYRFLPLLNVVLNHEYNTLTFDELGSQHLNLFSLATEIFFSNRLNWTTYVQYNEQIHNFNINSRLQWEYKPLSFVYLVFSDNYSESFQHKDWGISFKVNRRLNF